MYDIILKVKNSKFGITTKAIIKDNNGIYSLYSRSRMNNEIYDNMLNRMRTDKMIKSITIENI